MRPVHRPSYPRMLHPGAWWLWALGLATAASRTRNPVLLLLILAVAGLVVAARRSEAPWGRSFGAFLKLALLVIAIRVVFQAVLSESGQGSTVLFTLPEVPLPDVAAGIKLGGQVTLEALLRALYDGLQLAVVLCCVGAANSLASARRLLRSLPGALYEVGVASVVALTFAPQLLSDAQRVRAAQRLRGHRGRGLRSWARSAMPVLDSALERSVSLAAAMDSRGYGRTAGAPRATRMLTGLLTLGGLVGVCTGVYGLLGGGSYGLLGVPALVAGLVLAFAGLLLGGRRTRRSRYRPDPWAVPEALVAGSGVVAALTLIVTGSTDPAGLVLADPLAAPPVPWLAVLGILVAAMPAVLAPPPPRIAADPPTDPAAGSTDGRAREVAA